MDWFCSRATVLSLFKKTSNVNSLLSVKVKKQSCCLLFAQQVLFKLNFIIFIISFQNIENKFYWVLRNFKTQSLQFSSVAQSCLTPCNPMDCSMPSFPVHHQLLGYTQTHVHWFGDAIQPSHPLSSPSPPAFKLSQHQDLFQ